jgi:hypothetical protein
MPRFAKHMPGPMDPEKPWADDVLNRDMLAEQLTTALSTISQPFVLGLHSQFGNGKTFFLKRWQQELLNAGDVAVYFNAWETDYAAEPLIAFTAAIKNELEKHDLGLKRQEAKALARTAGRIVARSVLPRLASLATLGSAQASDITQIVDFFAGTASDLTDRAVEEVVRNHQASQNEIKEFHCILSKCAGKVASRDAGMLHRLVVFVDELDRCRPDYAIHVLECIKHFFSVHNMIFVISIDSQSLDASVRAVYGNGIDINGYLEKFFDYHVELESPSDHKFIGFVAKALDFHNFMGDDFDEAINLISSWCQALGLSLRAQEQVMTHINFIARMYDKGKFICDIIIVLLCLRAKCPVLFQKIAEREIEVEDLIVEIEHNSNCPSPWNNAAKDDLYRGKIVLLAGLFSPNALKSVKNKLETGTRSDLLEGGRWSPASLKALLEEAASRSPRQSNGGWPGVDVARRIRFLTR